VPLDIADFPDPYPTDGLAKAIFDEYPDDLPETPQTLKCAACCFQTHCLSLAYCATFTYYSIVGMSPTMSRYYMTLYCRS